MAYRVPTVAKEANTQNDYIMAIPERNIPTAYHILLSDRSQGTAVGVITGNSELHMQVQRFLLSLKRAYDNLERARKLKDNELKVFVGPEFYFRPNNNDKAYTFNEYKAFREVLPFTLVDQGIYKNWLIIFGTMVWTQNGEGSGKRPTVSLPAGEKLFYNTAVSVGISNSGSVSQQEVDKSETSSLDGLPQTYKPGIGQDAAGYIKTLPRIPAQGRLITVGGVTIGLDICLEHARYIRNLRLDLIKEAHRFGKKRLVHLHVLTSAGMKLYDFSSACIAGGYRMRVDGLQNDQLGIALEKVNRYLNATLEHSVYRRDANGGFIKGIYLRSPHHDDGVADSISSVSVRTTLGISSSDPLYLPNPANGDQAFWDARPQRITIYRSVRIPT